MGRAISFDLTDKNQIEINNSAIWTWLSLTDKSKHREVHKIWILQNILVPRLWWPLLIYEIPISTVLHFEQKISSYLRKWLCIHRSTSNICLYSSISPCPLPIKKLSSILKSSKVSGQLLLRDSLDSANIEITAGKWSGSEAVKDAQSRLEFEKILRYCQQSSWTWIYHNPENSTKKHSRLPETSIFCGWKVRWSRCT